MTLGANAYAGCAYASLELYQAGITTPGPGFITAPNVPAANLRLRITSAHITRSIEPARSQ